MKTIEKFANHAVQSDMETLSLPLGISPIACVCVKNNGASQIDAYKGFAAIVGFNWGHAGDGVAAVDPSTLTDMSSQQLLNMRRYRGHHA